MAADPKDWIGRGQTATDVLHPQPARFMQATLDRPATLSEGDALPPLWHWLYFLDAHPAGELGRDGHPRVGGFLPPVDLPPIRSVLQKQGRSGRLCFVTVVHELFQNGICALSEDHDIVYRQDPSPDSPDPIPPAAPEGAEVTRTVTPSPVLLFRYSALTFNGHRIHYDVDYARQVEGYEGLVFHGPLTATLLIELACEHRARPPRTFAFRATAPIAGMAPFHLEARSQGDALALWARRSDGALAMRARAEF